MPTEYATRKRVKRWKARAAYYQDLWIASQRTVLSTDSLLTTIKDLYFAPERNPLICAGPTVGLCNSCRARREARKAMGI